MAKSKNGNDVRIELRAVVYRHQKWWISHCLELDLVAEGATPVAALQDLMDIPFPGSRRRKSRAIWNPIFCAAPPEIWANVLAWGRCPAHEEEAAQVGRAIEAREAVLA